MKSNISEPLNRPIFHMLVFNQYVLLQQQVTTKRCSKKQAFWKKLFCTVAVLNLWSRILEIPVKEFHFSQFIVLHAASLPKKELFHNHFLKFLTPIVERCIIMVHWRCLKISNTKSGIPKRGDKIWRGMIAL